MVKEAHVGLHAPEKIRRLDRRSTDTEREKQLGARQVRVNPHSHSSPQLLPPLTELLRNTVGTGDGQEEIKK